MKEERIPTRQSLDLAVLEHSHEGLGGLFLPTVLSPPTQTSHWSW